MCLPETDGKRFPERVFGTRRIICSGLWLELCISRRKGSIDRVGTKNGAPGSPEWIVHRPENRLDYTCAAARTGQVNLSASPEHRRFRAHKPVSTSVMKKYYGEKCLRGHDARQVISIVRIIPVD